MKNSTTGLKHDRQMPELSQNKLLTINEAQYKHAEASSSSDDSRQFSEASSSSDDSRQLSVNKSLKVQAKRINIGIMGHVDAGKSTLCGLETQVRGDTQLVDYELRQSNDLT